MVVVVFAGSRFERLLARKARARDPELIQFTRELLDPPSQHPTRKLPWGPRSTPQAEFIFDLLNKQVRVTIAGACYDSKVVAPCCYYTV